jgi:hypothetical protein
LTANCQSSSKEPDVNKKIRIQLDWDLKPYHGIWPIIHIFLKYIIVKNLSLFSPVASRSPVSCNLQNLCLEWSPKNGDFIKLWQFPQKNKQDGKYWQFAHWLYDHWQIAAVTGQYAKG